jgi:hypothetical protein
MRRFPYWIALFSAALGGLTGQEPSADRIVIPWARSDRGGTLIIQHDKGSISVVGSEASAVIVEAFRRGLPSPEAGDPDARGMKLIAGPPTGLRAVEAGGTVTVTTEGRGQTLDLLVRVPRDFSLKLSTVHNGRIDVENVSGEMEITNGKGDIRLEKVAGSAVLNTFDGRITARFIEVTPGAPMAFTSIYGRIDVAFPADVRMTVRMKSDNGLIYSDFDLKTEAPQTRRRELPARGGQSLSSEGWSAARLNGGGPETLLKSFDGNIYLRKIK